MIGGKNYGYTEKEMVKSKNGCKKVSVEIGVTYNRKVFKMPQLQAAP